MNFRSDIATRSGRTRHWATHHYRARHSGEATCRRPLAQSAAAPRGQPAGGDVRGRDEALQDVALTGPPRTELLVLCRLGENFSGRYMSGQLGTKPELMRGLRVCSTGRTGAQLPGVHCCADQRRELSVGGQPPSKHDGEEGRRLCGGAPGRARPNRGIAPRQFPFGGPAHAGQDSTEDDEEQATITQAARGRWRGPRREAGCERRQTPRRAARHGRSRPWARPWPLH